MIKAVIFDFDGVIHDTLDLAYSINKKLGSSLTLDNYKDCFNGNIYKHFKLADSKEFFRLQHEEFKKLVISSSIKEELLRLKKGYRLFIITSNQESTLNAYLENNGIMKVFEDILGVETHTSKQEKFMMILESHGLARDECVFVTDTLGDILEAGRVGIRTIAVDYGFHERERLEKGKPFCIISDFSDLMPVLKDM